MTSLHPPCVLVLLDRIRIGNSRTRDLTKKPSITIIPGGRQPDNTSSPVPEAVVQQITPIGDCSCNGHD